MRPRNDTALHRFVALCSHRRRAFNRTGEEMLLEEFVTLNREALIVACQANLAKRPDPPAEALPIDHGVPVFLDRRVQELRVGLSGNGAISAAARPCDVPRTRSIAWLTRSTRGGQRTRRVRGCSAS